MEEVSEDILFLFKDLTGFDVEQFFEDYLDFMDNHYVNVLSFFSGNSEEPNRESFQILEDLVRQCINMIQLFNQNRLTLSDYDGWILLEKIEDVQESLRTITALPKYLRTTLSQGSYTNKLFIDYTIKQGETLEGIMANRVSSDNPNEDWPELAIDNQIKEEDYTSDGGVLLKVSLNNQSRFTLNSIAEGISKVIDVYGKDIDRNIIFEDSDLRVLSPEDTIRQSADILANLSKGDNPIFPDHGVDKRLIIGNTRSSLTYPTIFRQLAETFANDDTFKSFAIRNVTSMDDAVFVEFTVETRAGEFLDRSIRF